MPNKPGAGAVGDITEALLGKNAVSSSSSVFIPGIKAGPDTDLKRTLSDNIPESISNALQRSSHIKLNSVAKNEEKKALRKSVIARKVVAGFYNWRFCYWISSIGQVIRL